MNDYETARAAKIAHNRALLSSLNLEHHALAPRTQRAPSKPAPRNRVTKPTQPTRTSSRLASRPPAPESTNVDLEALDRSLTTRPRKQREVLPAPGPSVPPDIAVRWTHGAPARNSDGSYAFSDFPAFQPNISPPEMLHLGVFGGAFFAPHYSSVTRAQLQGDWDEVPAAWREGLNVRTQLASARLEPLVNRYKVKAGQSLSEWEKNGWVWGGDPRGWFQWYVRFWMGRRVEGEDERQVGRWAKCVGARGRWRRRLVGEYVRHGVRRVGEEGEEVSRVVRQICLQWGWEVTQDVLDEAWAAEES